MFEKCMVAGWGDMDFNSHMRNTAYLDRAADIRMMFFAEHGFPMSEFMRLRLGPVVRKDEIKYYSEINDPYAAASLTENMALSRSLLSVSF